MKPKSRGGRSFWTVVALLTIASLIGVLARIYRAWADGDTDLSGKLLLQFLLGGLVMAAVLGLASLVFVTGRPRARRLRARFPDALVVPASPGPTTAAELSALASYATNALTRFSGFAVLADESGVEVWTGSFKLRKVWSAKSSDVTAVYLAPITIGGLQFDLLSVTLDHHPVAQLSFVPGSMTSVTKPSASEVARIRAELEVLLGSGKK